MDIYAYQRLVGKINDDVTLREEFIKLYDGQSHSQMVKFSIEYAKYLMDKINIRNVEEINAGLEFMAEWLEWRVNYNPARNKSIELSRIAKNEKDIVVVKFYRTIAQLLACPHVKYHALWGTDMAITMINNMYPDDIKAVSEERKLQINILKKII